MPYCSNCGAQNPDTAKFCINCGAVMSNGSSAVQQLATGSRVSFVAGDGKSYTGTIREINGDQYKIKYDTANFEIWLKRNQFTPLAASAVPPVYNPATGPAAVQAHSATTSHRHYSQPFFTHLGFWGSVMIIIGFFTDWLHFTDGGITGYRILSSAQGILNDTNNDKTFVFMLVAIAGILLSAIICLFYTITGLGRAAFSLFKILPLLIIIGFVAYIIVRVQENSGDLDIQADSSVWRVIGIGIYFTLVGSLVLAISRFRK